MNKYLLRFYKRANMRFISHLDLGRLFRRAIKKAGIDVEYSQGFNPEKLTDEQIDKIVQDMLQRKSEIIKYEYLIPMTEGGIKTYWMRSK